ncbi:MAG: hypothetical protein ABI228_01030 [Burkholderiaceae bacterium]
MKTKQIVTAVFCAMIASAGVSALAADNPAPPDKSGMTTQENMGGAMMQGGTMGGAMMGHGMMGNSAMGCPMMGGGAAGGGMMGGAMMGGHSMVSQLPAGNEKLQLQMQAEIMQKVGEIIGRYADKVVINKGEAQ